MNRRLACLAAWLGTVLAAQPGEVWTLEQALDFALAHNPDTHLAQQRIAAAQAGLEQANAAFWPRVQLQSGYIRSDNPMTVFGSILNQHAYSSSLNFNDVPDVDNFNARGLVSVPLYTGGRNVAGRDAARANKTAAQQENGAVCNALAFEVARGFYASLKTREFIAAAVAAVSSFETNLALANKRLDAGTLLKSDVLDMEVRLAQAREDLVRARNAQALAQRMLRNLLGLDQGDFIVSDSVPSVSAPPSRDFSRRPELAAARARAEAAQAQVRGAKGGRKPRVNAFGSLDYDYGTRFDNDGESYTAGVMAQWDLWDGNLTRARVREASAGLEAALEEERKLRLAIDFEVEEARLNLDAANERLFVTGKVVAQAAESTELLRARFEQGLALSTSLIDAETALVAARVHRAEAEADQRIAIAALRKALAWPQLDSQPTAK